MSRTTAVQESSVPVSNLFLIKIQTFSFLYLKSLTHTKKQQSSKHAAQTEARPSLVNSQVQLPMALEHGTGPALAQGHSLPGAGVKVPAARRAAAMGEMPESPRDNNPK